MKAIFSILSCLFFLNLGATELKITGTVYDGTGKPLPYVNVIVKGTIIRTHTDFDGHYEITAHKGDILVFSYVGFETQEVKIGNKSVLDVTMEAGSQLDEVVITAKGVKREKKALGYAVVEINAESVSQDKIVRHLQGKIAGTQISNMAVGSGNNLIIRGKNSLPDASAETYANIDDNSFKSTSMAPLSTFSIDVDRASYSNIRRMINNGQNIPEDAVKVEEMINYFHYNYPQPKGNDPFSITTDVSNSPWNSETKLVRIGLKGKDISSQNTPASNLVFLIDVSGSMGAPNKLGLLKASFGVLVDQLREQDKVSIVVYAGAAGLVLPPTSGSDKETIMNAIENLSAGGSTAGGEGIALAYKIAEENYIKEANNRVVLATDGDFNVGISSDGAMENLIEKKRKSGVFLTVLGFGMGNYKDSKMEILADKGNGNHAYIDTMQEAKKVLGTEFFGTIYTIAKDVKIQVEFNPTKVQAYRLIGYENRLLNDEDFNDDTKDVGELGSGHTITALYEVIPVGVNSKYLKKIDKLKYSKSVLDASSSEELLTVKFRYKDPDSNTSKLIVNTLKDETKSFEAMSDDFKFSAAVALFGQQLRNSDFISLKNKKDVIAIAEQGRGKDSEGYRAEFIRLVKSY